MPRTQEIDQVGKREDLSDMLVVADAKNTPLTSMMKKSKKPTNSLYEWPVGQIPAPDTTPIADGAPVDTEEDLSGNRAILRNRVHKLRRVFGVSEMAQDISDPAGVKDEFQHNKMNALVAIKRAIEAVFAGDQDSNLTGTTHQTRGLGSWINSTAQTDNPVPTDYRTPTGSIYSGSLADLSEDDARLLMQSIYEQTGEKGSWDALVGTALKAHFSKMTIHDEDVPVSGVNVRTFFAKLESNELCAVIDVIKGDFGQMRLHPTLWNGFNNTTKLPNSKRGYVLDMSDLDMCANKLPGFKPLPDDDSGPNGLVSAIVGNRMGSPLKHGAFKAT